MIRQAILQQYARHREILQNFLWRCLQILSTQGLTFLIFIICAKLLSSYEFGIYNYVLTTTSLLMIFGDFGISTATTKYVAAYQATQRDKLPLVLWNAGLLIGTLSLVTTAVTIMFGGAYLGETYWYVVLVLPVVLLAPLASLFDGIYSGLKQFKVLAWISALVGGVSVVYIYVLIKLFGLTGALLAQTLFYLLLSVVLLCAHRDFRLRMNTEVMAEIGEYGLVIGAGKIGLFLYTRIDILFLGHYGYLTEISYYEIINRTLIILLTPMTILAQVIAPNIASLQAQRAYREIRKKFNLYMLLSFVAAVVLVLVLFVFQEQVIFYVFSKYKNADFSRLFTLVLIAYFSQILNSIIPIGFTTATGHANLITYYLVICGGMHIFLNALLLEKFGFIGIFYSLILTRVLTDICFLLHYYYKICHLNDGYST